MGESRGVSYQISQGLVPCQPACPLQRSGAGGEVASNKDTRCFSLILSASKLKATVETAV